MLYGLLAFATVLFHLAFILFVVLGGLLVVRRPRLAPVHLAAAAWGAYVSLANRICPLTPLENWFRRQAGASGYAGTFLEHYMLAVIYPSGLTVQTQRVLGVVVIVLNAVIYAWVLKRRRAVVTPRKP